jgi:hypothetical protein
LSEYNLSLFVSIFSSASFLYFSGSRNCLRVSPSSALYFSSQPEFIVSNSDLWSFSQNAEFAPINSTHFQSFHGTGTNGIVHSPFFANFSTLVISPPFHSLEAFTAIHTKNQDIATHITQTISWANHTLNHAKSICIIHST